MPSRKSVKNCRCTECVNFGGPNGRDWDSSAYKGHRARARVEFASASSHDVAAASDEFFITTLTDGRVTSLPSSTDNATAAPSMRLSESFRPAGHKSSSRVHEMPMPPLADISD